MSALAATPGVLGWFALAVAVLLARRAGRVRHRHAHRAAGRTARPQLPRMPGSASTVAVVALGVACIAVGGVPAGLVAALVCCPATAHALRRLQSRPAKAPDDPALPVTLDLVAAALRSGQPVATALVVAAPAAGAATGQELLRVAGLLRRGADPAQAGGAVGARAGPIDEVARVAIRSSSSGVKLAGAFVELADQLRAQRSAQLAVRANRAGIAAMAPLAACYLPSFVCLGVVPAVVGIATSTVGVLP